jgi:hypothetical protein
MTQLPFKKFAIAVQKACNCRSKSLSGRGDVERLRAARHVASVLQIW